MRRRFISLMLCCIISVAMLVPVFADGMVAENEPIEENEVSVDDELATDKDYIAEDADDFEIEMVEEVEESEAIDEASTDIVIEETDLLTDEENESSDDLQEDGAVYGDWEYGFVDSSDKSKGIKITG